MPGPPIHVEFRRSGGFAGIPLTASTSTDKLAGEHAAPLRDLLAGKSGAGPRPEGSSAPGGFGADRFQYQLRLDDGQHQRAFSWNEAQVPDEIRPVLGELTRLAKPG